MSDLAISLISNDGKIAEFSFLDYPLPEASCLIINALYCEHSCKGCQNKEAMEDKLKETSVAMEDFLKILQIETNRNKTYNLVFEGGDILHKSSIGFLKEFIKWNNQNNKIYNICIYTGNGIEFIKNNFEKGDVNFWKCGTFKEALKRESLKDNEKFILASPNQNFYDSNFKKISKDGILYFKKQEKRWWQFWK